MTADTALRLARYFGTSAGFWMGLPDDYELEEARIKLGSDLDNILDTPTQKGRDEEGS